MAQTYLIKSSPTAGNRNKGTVSVWVKRSSLGSTQNIYTDFYSTDNFGGIRFNSGDNLGVFSYAGASAQLDINTTRVFRDVNSWYHIVVAWDTTDGTSTDRIKIYINGERETSFTGSPTYPSSSQDLIFGIGGSYPIVIGRRGTDNNEYFDGSMSHFHRVDNQALAPTVFGSTDSTTGEWKINTSPSITYTGSSDYNFFILKDGNSVTDQSGQSNNLTVGYGTLTKTEDCPSNVFATMNPLNVPTSNPPTFSNGNTKTVTAGSSGRFGGTSTLGMSSGKFYVEAKATVAGNPRNCIGTTYEPSEQARNNGTQYSYADSISYNAETGDVVNSSGTIYSASTYTTGDIIQMAIDMDNDKLYFGKNGTWLNSGVPTSGSTGTGAVSLTADKTQFIIQSDNTSGSDQSTFEFNFGNGYFGTTAVATNSGNGYAGAEGSSIFNYQPPTNYTALSTKGLNL